MSLRSNSQSGQSLVEVLVALALLALVITALARITATAVHNAQFAKNQALATRYAEKLMEETREERDRNPGNFFTPEFVDLDCNSGPDIIVDTIFSRKRDCFLLEDNGKKTMDVVTTVSWSEGGKNYDSKLETTLTNWK